MRRTKKNRQTEQQQQQKSKSNQEVIKNESKNKRYRRHFAYNVFFLYIDILHGLHSDSMYQNLQFYVYMQALLQIQIEQKFCGDIRGSQFSQFSYIFFFI